MPAADSTSLLFIAEPAGATAAVAFVHGLGGHCLDTWGAAGSPGTFLTRLRADLPHAAVATLDYPSDLKHFAGDETLTLETVARQWARVLRDTLLARYDTVAIVAHCMGGLLTTLALRQLLADDAHDVQEKVLLLFLLDAPHDLPEAGPGDWLAGLLGALRFLPAAFRANARYWRERIPCNGAGHSAIHAFAVTSEQQSWVTPLHPDAGLPEDHVCRVSQAHTELSRAPAAGAFPPYDFVLARLRAGL